MTREQQRHAAGGEVHARHGHRTAAADPPHGAPRPGERRDHPRSISRHSCRESERTWAEMGRDKWKLGVTAEMPTRPLWVNGDLSHLQQASRTSLFNARDATFEMRNYLRDEAKREPDPAARDRNSSTRRRGGARSTCALARRRLGRSGSPRQRDRHDRGGAAELPQDALHHEARQRALRRLQRRDGAGAVVRGDGARTPRGGTRNRVRPAARHDVPGPDSARSADPM